jgi:hypothetical protein
VVQEAVYRSLEGEMDRLCKVIKRDGGGDHETVGDGSGLCSSGSVQMDDKVC